MSSLNPAPPPLWPQAVDSGLHAASSCQELQVAEAFLPPHFSKISHPSLPQERGLYFSSSLTSLISIRKLPGHELAQGLIPATHVFFRGAGTLPLAFCFSLPPPLKIFSPPAGSFHLFFVHLPPLLGWEVTAGLWHKPRFVLTPSLPCQHQRASLPQRLLQRAWLHCCWQLMSYTARVQAAEELRVQGGGWFLLSGLGFAVPALL